jgi:hypothetical protein
LFPVACFGLGDCDERECTMSEVNDMISFAEVWSEISTWEPTKEQWV